MNEEVLYQIGLVLVIGMTAQALAIRFAIPSIVLLLAAGTLIGPDMLALVDPQIFGDGRQALVTLAVTIILFEGALALDIDRLRLVQRSLFRLLTIGAVITLVGAALAVRFALELPWSIAWLFGALMIVTGPTVVTPLLSRRTIDREVRELLIGEGVLIDPIGAIAAIVALDVVLGRQGLAESAPLLVGRLAMGTVMGGAAGALAAVALRRRWIAEELQSPLLLASVLFVSATASRMSAEAGLMAAVAMGATLANARVPGLGRLREFKEALTVLLLSFIFILLTADLRLADVMTLKWGGLGVVAIVVWVIRPLAVLVSTQGGTLTVRQRLFVAWICPRGIVAAAVAGLFRLLLDQHGLEGGRELQALVFGTIAVTVIVQGLSAGLVAHLLGIDAPPRGAVVIGADHLGRLLAQLLTRLGCHTALVDRDPAMCRAATAEGLSVYAGDALALETLEEAGARYAGTVVTMTRNPELNALIVQRLNESLRIERLLPLVDDAEDEEAKPLLGLFPGNFPGIDEVNLLLRRRKLALQQYEVPDEMNGRTLLSLPYDDGEFALVLVRSGRPLVATGDLALVPGDRVWCLTRPGTKSSVLETLIVVVEEPAPAT